MSAFYNAEFDIDCAPNKLLLPTISRIKGGSSALKKDQLQLNKFSNQLTFWHLFGGRPVNRQAYRLSRNTLKKLRGVYTKEAAAYHLQVIDEVRELRTYTKYFTQLNKAEFWTIQQYSLSLSNRQRLAVIINEWFKHGSYAHFTTDILQHINQQIQLMKQSVESLEQKIKIEQQKNSKIAVQTSQCYLDYLTHYKTLLFDHERQLHCELFTRLECGISWTASPWGRLNQEVKNLGIILSTPKLSKPESVDVAKLAAICRTLPGHTLRYFSFTDRLKKPIRMVVVHQSKRVLWVPAPFVPFIPKKPPFFKRWQPNKQWRYEQWRYDWCALHQTELVRLLHNNSKTLEDSAYWQSLLESTTSLKELSASLKQHTIRKWFSTDIERFLEAGKFFLEDLEKETLIRKLNYLQIISDDLNRLPASEPSLDYSTIIVDLDNCVKYHMDLYDRWQLTREKLLPLLQPPIVIDKVEKQIPPMKRAKLDASLELSKNDMIVLRPTRKANQLNQKSSLKLRSTSDCSI